MKGLPFVNERLSVEAIGFRELDDHLFGVLLSPWFMNMVVLPGNDEWSGFSQGDRVTVTLPSDDYEFTVSRDEALPGEILSAVLFTTVADFPDQETAREVALDILTRLFEPREPDPDDAEAAEPKPMSRRSLLSGGSAS